MLALSIRPAEAVVIELPSGEKIHITNNDKLGIVVRVGIDAPRHLKISRTSDREPATKLTERERILNDARSNARSK